jgi:ketosteroid isomerase-like protein
MRKLNVILLSSIAVLFMMLAVSSASAKSSYAEDRSQIEDLHARYMYAMNFDDVEALVSLFSKDGVFDVGWAVLRGQDEIRKSTNEKVKKIEAEKAKDPSNKVPAYSDRHFVTNIVLKINGNKAVGECYWFRAAKTGPERSTVLASYGTYDDEFVKVNGKWLFSLRKIEHVK